MTLSRVYPFVALAALLGAWQAFGTLVAAPKWLAPLPSDIALVLTGRPDIFTIHSVRTIQEAVLGLAAALVAGVLLAIAMDRHEPTRGAIYPMVVISQTIPIIAIAPLLVIWLGYGIAPKVVIVALVCFFPILVGTFDGLRAVDGDLIDMLRAMGANGWQQFWRVRWPASLPRIFSGARVGVTYGMIGAIVGEWVGASEGLGVYMLRAVDQLQTDRVFAAIVVTSALSLILFQIVALVERVCVPWNRRPGS
ncbi:MAG: ABC transporter permease [Chloroflexota bacterium]|nr:MAG: ABC transporter permease [Chloroflexota bacterium]